LYNATDRFEEAENAFRTALEFNPDDMDIWTNLGVVLSVSGKTDEAERVFKKAVEDRPDHLVAWLNLIQLLYREGRDKEAERAEDTARAHVSNFDDFLDSLGEFVEEAENRGQDES
jgi:Flp pilus assembly protein TadD